jgi:hypothetical protein
VTLNDGLAIATVYDYRQPTAQGATKPDQPGYVWGAVDVKVCAGSGTGQTDKGIGVSHNPWFLVYADARTFEHSPIGYQQFQQPEYPWDEHLLLWGQCLRGWITFAVPGDQRPAKVQYQPSTGDVIEWKVT